MALSIVFPPPIINPCTPALHLYLKIPKHNPGHTNVPSHPSPIYAFVDFHLQPIVHSISSYIKYTNHFLTILCSFSILLSVNTLLGDTVSLYTNVQHTIGLSTLRKLLSKCPHSS